MADRCGKHRQNLRKYDDGTKACVDCVSELVEINEPRGGRIIGEFKEKLPEGQLKLLWDLISSISTTVDVSRSEAVLYFLATKALRTGQTIDEVINTILKDGSIAILTK